MKRAEVQKHIANMLEEIQEKAAEHRDVYNIGFGSQESGAEVRNRVRYLWIQHASTNVNDGLRQKISQVSCVPRRSKFLKTAGRIDGTPVPSLARVPLLFPVPSGAHMKFLPDSARAWQSLPSRFFC